MADTIRELIIQDVVAQLGTLTTANGYNTSCGQDVRRGETEVPLADLPASVVLPGEDSAEHEFGQQNCTMPVEIHALHKRGDLNISVLGEQMLGDLISCLVGGRDSIGYIDRLHYSGGGIEEYPGPEDQALSVRASIEVEYTTLIGDPYTQP